MGILTTSRSAATALIIGISAPMVIPASAAPLALAALAPAVSTAGDAPELILVSGGCGWHFHRTPYGFCRPNFVYRGYYRPHFGWGWRHRWHRFWY